MPALLFVSFEILLLLALALSAVGVRAIVLKRLLAFLLLLALPFASPYFLPLLILIFSACIALAPDIVQEKEKEKKKAISLWNFTKISSLLLASFYFGTWLFFVFPDAREIFRLLPLDSDFHPASWQILQEELRQHRIEAASSLATLLLSGALALRRLFAWRKANASHKH